AEPVIRQFNRTSAGPVAYFGEKLVVGPDVISRIVGVRREHQQLRVGRVLELHRPDHGRDVQPEAGRVELDLLGRPAVVDAYLDRAAQAHEELLADAVRMRAPDLAARHVEDHEVAERREREIVADLADRQSAARVVVDHLQAVQRHAADAEGRDTGPVVRERTDPDRRTVGGAGWHGGSMLPGGAAAGNRVPRGRGRAGPETTGPWPCAASSAMRAPSRWCGAPSRVSACRKAWSLPVRRGWGSARSRQPSPRRSTVPRRVTVTRAAPAAP